MEQTPGRVEAGSIDGRSWGETTPGRGDSQCKGPEAGTGLTEETEFRTSQTTKMFGILNLRVIKQVLLIEHVRALKHLCSVACAPSRP